MCSECGCGSDQIKINGHKIDLDHEHKQMHTHAHVHTHTHDHIHNGQNHSHPHQHIHEHMHDDHNHHHDRLHDWGEIHDHSHDQELDSYEKKSRIVQLEQDLLAKNNKYAEQNRDKFKQQEIFVLNLVSSPGSGKTSLLVKTITELKKRDVSNISVIEGDQQTDNDANKIKETKVPVIQINTGKGCHLDAQMIDHTIEDLKPSPKSLLFIENVGNLVCPAAFDLGEDHKVVIYSVTEGEDKPLKYPDMFTAADMLLLNKIDLLDYLDFDIDQAIVNAKKVNPKIQIMKISAKTEQGFDQWINWLLVCSQAKFN